LLFYICCTVILTLFLMITCMDRISSHWKKNIDMKYLSYRILVVSDKIRM
jgi:hypothetical protein